MIIETWEVVKYNYIIVFILSTYTIGSFIYIFYNHKKKSWTKVLTHFIIGAIIVLIISYTISSVSYKRVFVLYQYETDTEVVTMQERGWRVDDINTKHKRVLFSKEYKKTKIRWFYPSKGGNKIEDY